MKPFHDYNSILKKYSRKHRNHSTKAEIRMWCELLRAKKMKGYSFNRQRPIGNFIADFYSAKLNLVIEVDGFTHEDPDVQKKDVIKQRYLEELGMKVIRFSDYEVHHEILKVKERLEGVIDELEAKAPPEGQAL